MKSFYLYTLIFIGGIFFLQADELSRIGVLDFANLTGSKDYDWVAEAFSEALSRKLSKVVDMSVMRREELRDMDNVRRLSNKKIKDGDARELARLAGLHFLVFGSVQTSSKINDPKAPLRVHARLVDTRRGIVHQAVSVDGHMNELFALQYKLTLKFIDLTKIEISIAEMKAMQSNATLDLEAYRMYTLGTIEKKHKRYKQAILHFEKAMKKHTGILYADAHHEIGQVYLLMGRKAELVKRFRNDVSKLAPIYYDLGLAYKNAGKFKKALDAFKTFVDASKRRTMLWELQVEDENFRMLCSKETNRAVMIQKGKIQGIDTHTGSVLWTSKVDLPKSARLRFQKQSFIIRDGKEEKKIDIETGNAQLAKEILDNTPAIEANKNDVNIVISETSVEVLDKEKGELLWNYKVDKKDRILDHDGKTFFVKRGRHRLRALRIQRGYIPGQVEGLIEMGKCLDDLNRSKEAIEIYRYIVDHIDEKHPLASEKIKLEESRDK